jgi:hypothetical protein
MQHHLTASSSLDTTSVQQQSAIVFLMPHRDVACCSQGAPISATKRPGRGRATAAASISEFCAPGACSGLPRLLGPLSSPGGRGTSDLGLERVLCTSCCGSARGAETCCEEGCTSLRAICNCRIFASNSCAILRVLGLTIAMN